MLHGKSIPCVSRSGKEFAAGGTSSKDRLIALREDKKIRGIFTASRMQTTGFPNNTSQCP